MSKRIPNLSEVILTQAARLFLTMGYDAVDMKHVAAEVGTSVGNLYNYFPSKPALFTAVKDSWKQQLLETCRAILASLSPRREKILTILGRFYDDVSEWHGIWHEYMADRDEVSRADCKNKRGAPHWVTDPETIELIGSFDALLLGQPTSTPPYRWAFLIITATVQLAVRHPQYREENWKFIETLVDKI